MEMENKDKRQMPLSNTPPDMQHKMQQLEGEVARIRETVERTNSDTAKGLAHLETSQLDHEMELKSRSRRSNVLWVVVVLLVAGLIGASWYGYPLLQKHASLLAQMPESISSLGNSLGKRMDATEEQVRAWARDRNMLGEQLTKLEKRVTANLQLARKESREMVAQVSQRFQAEMDRRMEPMQARIDKLESSQQAEQARLEQLRSEVRSEVSSLRNSTADEIAGARRDSSREISSVNQQVALTKRNLDDLSKQLDHSRVDFEVAKNQVRELVPGISLKVTHTNPAYQNVDGYLQLVPDAHTLWVRGQDINQPVIFFSDRDKRPYQMVFTRVTKDAILGYLLVPAETGGNNTASMSGDGQVATSAPPSK